jgi:hypothetical protein
MNAPRLRLAFDRDVVPRSERENPDAFSPFDWETVFLECDGELEAAVAGLGIEDRRKLAEALSRILRWVYSDGRGAKQRRVDQAVGRRVIALGLHLSPELVPYRTAELARDLGLSRQALYKARDAARNAFPTG